MAAFTLSEYFNTNFHSPSIDKLVQSETKISTSSNSKTSAASAAHRQRLHKSKYLNPIKNQRKSNANNDSPLVISITNTNTSNSSLSVSHPSGQRAGQPPVLSRKNSDPAGKLSDIDDFGLKKSLIDPELNKKISDLCWRLSIKDTQQRQNQHHIDHKQLLNQQLKATNLNYQNLQPNFLPKIDPSKNGFESASSTNLNKLANQAKNSSKQQKSKQSNPTPTDASTASALTAAFLVDLNRQSLESVSTSSGMSSENLNKNRFFLNYLLNRKAFHNQLNLAAASNNPHTQVPIKIHTTSTHRHAPSDSPNSFTSNLSNFEHSSSLTTMSSSNKSRCSSITSSKAEFGESSKAYFKFENQCLNASTSTKLNDQDSFLSVNKMPAKLNRLKPLYLSNKSQVELEEYLNIASKIESQEKPKPANTEKSKTKDKSPKRSQRVLVSQDTISTKSLYEQTISSPSSTSPQLSPFEQSPTHSLSPKLRPDKLIKTPSPILADQNLNKTIIVPRTEESPSIESNSSDQAREPNSGVQKSARQIESRTDSLNNYFDFTRVESPHKLGKAMASGYKFVSHSSMNVGLKTQSDYSQQFEMFQSNQYSHPNFHTK